MLKVIQKFDLAEYKPKLYRLILKSHLKKLTLVETQQILTLLLDNKKEDIPLNVVRKVVQLYLVYSNLMLIETVTWQNQYTPKKNLML